MQRRGLANLINGVSDGGPFSNESHNSSGSTFSCRNELKSLKNYIIVKPYLRLHARVDTLSMTTWGIEEYP